MNTKHYIVYKTTNLINEKIYIGTHITKDLIDSYLGSGRIFRRAVIKYGKANFSRETLFVFDNPEEMFSKEQELVNEEFVSRKDTYNTHLGGKGGWTLQEQKAGASTTNSKYKHKLKEWSAKGYKRRIELIESGDYDPTKWAREHPDEAKKFAEIARQKSLTNESRTKRKNTVKKNSHAQGAKNSQYGTCWMTNGINTIKVSKQDSVTYLSAGWILGRKIKCVLGV